MIAQTPDPKLAMRVTMPDDAEAIEVGPGCIRRDLPSRPGVRIWLVEMKPGSSWPRVDKHDEKGEDYVVLSGSLIEGERLIEAGAHVHFGPDSSHRPRTLTGVTMFGFNLI